MLGWEYPPHISGGLGTACQGLTLALAKRNHEITFVVPHLFGNELAPHMDLVDTQQQSNSDLPQVSSVTNSMDGTGIMNGAGILNGIGRADRKKIRRASQVSTVQIASLLSPYFSPDDYQMVLESLNHSSPMPISKILLEEGTRGISKDTTGPTSFRPYGQDIFSEVERYAAQTLENFIDQEFDVIHAHDWMTVPAAVLLANKKKTPLVLHVHSLEHDRSGSNPHPKIEAIERLGISLADRVIAVSHYTKRIIHTLTPSKDSRVVVVHNGVYQQKIVRQYQRAKNARKRVLFLGRVTMQKGPDYFVEAAVKIIPHVPDVEFMVAGAGDMLPRLKDRVRELGFESYFTFPGFLTGKEVERAYALADVYVMPSVSEPFGIAALEAIKFDTPVIVSKQSGVSEVLSHALKVDFWDTHKLADCIINALQYSELREDMLAMAREEVKRLHWDAAADRVDETYRDLV